MVQEAKRALKQQVSKKLARTGGSVQSMRMPKVLVEEVRQNIRLTVCQMQAVTN